jgi:two-component system, NarL family, nitrate/nitrite response regulator NarL
MRDDPASAQFRYPCLELVNLPVWQHRGARSMNLLLVDDHALFREGLSLLLSKLSPGIVIHEAVSVEAAVNECEANTFRMALLDLGLTATSGFETLDTFRSRITDVPVVVLSGDQDPQLIKASIARGAVGFVPKAYTADMMIAALQFILAGGIYLPACVLETEASVVNRPGASTAEVPPNLYSRLSPRQQEVARYLLQGLSNKTIARRLNISEGTIKAHVSSIFQIVGARNRVEAVMIAAKGGFSVM